MLPPPSSSRCLLRSPHQVGVVYGFGKVWEGFPHRSGKRFVLHGLGQHLQVRQTNGLLIFPKARGWDHEEQPLLGCSAIGDGLSCFPVPGEDVNFGKSARQLYQVMIARS